MVTDTDGLILRQVKLPEDRRMLVLFTRKYGKISAGTNIKINGKNRSSLALRAFTHGRYELFRGREIFNINAAETLESYFKIGEDVDKYLYCSYALEFTDKVTQEYQPSEQALDTLIDFLRIMETRKSKLKSVVIVYQWKLIDICGYMPSLDQCVRCGSKEIPAVFSVADGGVLCGKCKNSGKVNLRLLYELKFDIIKTLKFIKNHDMKSFEKLALNNEISAYMEEILKEYISYHLDINNLKSESYLTI